MNTLYHYCSLETFISIIKNKTIRLSDIGKSNDYMESKWLLFSYLEKEVLRQYEKEPFINSNGVIYGLNDKEAIKFFVENEKKKALSNQDQVFYAACFSENGDILSQWRGYADDGQGVSIGFNLEILKRLTADNDVLELHKVIYPPKRVAEAPEIIQKYADELLNCIYGLIDSGNTKSIYFNEHSTDQWFSWLTTNFYQESIIYKNPAFKQEQEWRLIYNNDECCKDDDWSMWYNKESNKPTGYLSKYFPNGLEFRSQGDNIASYFDLTFRGTEDNIIDKIIIGPKSKITKADISQLLCYYQYYLQPDINDIVKKSSATYR